MSLVCSTTWKPILRTNERALDPTQGLDTEREKWKLVVKLEYFLNLAKFASLLAPLEEVDKLEGVRVLQQVKSQNRGKPCLQGINCHGIRLLTIITITSNSSTPPEIRAQLGLHRFCQQIFLKNRRLYIS